MERRRRSSEDARIVVDVRVPRWAAWSAAFGVLTLGAANVAAVVVLTVAR
ncbi:hypothetical protein HCA58_04885 [Micromonospora sp. HNM0581]|nr:hypothetical protein [Micromonospora sp. HNM0581]NLU77741.1 hypothetical protein [Micromonospora sp. HNM0581]